MIAVGMSLLATAFAAGMFAADLAERSVQRGF